MSIKTRKLALEKAEAAKDEPSKRGGKRAGSGNKKGVRLAPATRERIRGAMLIHRLEQIACDKVQSEPHQVTAALGLLRFCLPTLQATDLTSQGKKLTVNIIDFSKKPDDGTK